VVTSSGQRSCLGGDAQHRHVVLQGRSWCVRSVWSESPIVETMTEQREAIDRDVALTLAQMSKLVDFEFGLDRRSVQWVEGFIARQRARPDVDPATMEQLASVLGSFLGACVVANTDGRWERHEEFGWGVKFPNGDMAFPFAKVRKQITGGLESGDSILNFFDVAVDRIATGDIRRARSADEAEPGQPA